jgi:hypothetical protein
MDNGVLPQNPYAFAQMQHQQQQPIRPQDPSTKGTKAMAMDGKLDTGELPPFPQIIMADHFHSKVIIDHKHQCLIQPMLPCQV